MSEHAATRAPGDISPKVAAATVATAVATIAVWAIEATTGIDIPTLVEGAVAVVLTFGAGYIIRD